MKIRAIIFILLGFICSSMIFPQETDSKRSISPTISIRYDDILSGMTPSSTIGILLVIDDTKYSGFDTSSDGTELRILVGWKWTILGLGTKEIDLGDGVTDTVGMSTFGAKYRILDGMFTSMEYVRIEDEGIEVEGYVPLADFIRLSIGVEF